MIPELAFDDRATPSVTDVKLVRDRLCALMPRTMDFAIIGNRADFVSRKSRVDIGDVTLVALSHTPYRLDRSCYASPEVWIPFSGEMTAFDGSSEFPYGGSRAYFSASETRNVRTTTISALGLRFDMQRLKAVHAAMTGAFEARDIPLQSRLLELDMEGLDFVALMKNLLRQVDELELDGLALERLGVDDSFHRILACLLMPDLLRARESSGRLRNHTQERIARLCEFLHGNLNQPIALTDMEQISGLSARVLQYNFQKSFGMRPKQWLRKQRLHAARAVLMKSDGHIKLTALAYEFCFPSPSVFSRAYQLEFGELPSETLACRRMPVLF